MNKETYRVEDHGGFTKVLVYQRRYNPDILDEVANQYGRFEDTLAIVCIGDEK